jgi:hypothetical protein
MQNFASRLWRFYSLSVNSSGCLCSLNENWYVELLSSTFSLASYTEGTSNMQAWQIRISPHGVTVEPENLHKMTLSMSLFYTHTFILSYSHCFLWSMEHPGKALFHFSFLIFKQSIGLLGRRIRPSLGRYLHRTAQTQNKPLHYTG